MDFKHSYAQSAQRLWRKEPDGGWTLGPLLVIANIAMDPNATGYDAEKAAKLETDAVFFASQRSIPGVLFAEDV